MSDPADVHGGVELVRSPPSRRTMRKVREAAETYVPMRFRGTILAALDAWPVLLARVDALTAERDAALEAKACAEDAIDEWQEERADLWERVKTAETLCAAHVADISKAVTDDLAATQAERDTALRDLAAARVERDAALSRAREAEAVSANYGRVLDETEGKLAAARAEVERLTVERDQARRDADVWAQSAAAWASKEERR